MTEPYIVATSASATEPLRLQTLPRRTLHPEDMRVRVRAIGVNPVDWKMREGGPLRMAHRFLGPRGPLVVGVDFAGEVIERGAIAAFKVGARLVGGADFSRGQFGSYANEVVVRGDQCAELPLEVSYEAAASVPIPGATAMRAFEVAKLEGIKAPRVLVLGAAGGVGLVTLQLTRAMGAETYGVCSTRNVALVEELGARAIDYTKGDALEAASKFGPFDLVFNCVGTDLYDRDASVGLLKPTGLLALAVVRPQDTLSMLFSSQVESVFGRPTRKVLEPLVAALAKGDLVPRIEKRFKLDEAEKAHELSKGGKVVGKLVIVPDR